MMGPKQEAQAALFYEFSLEDHVPQDHLLRSIDRFVDLSSIRTHLADFYSHSLNIREAGLLHGLLCGFTENAYCIRSLGSNALTTSRYSTCRALD